MSKITRNDRAIVFDFSKFEFLGSMNPTLSYGLSDEVRSGMGLNSPWGTDSYSVTHMCPITDIPWIFTKNIISVYSIHWLLFLTTIQGVNFFYYPHIDENNFIGAAIRHLSSTYSGLNGNLTLTCKIFADSLPHV
jgi:hypothetical protein